MFLHPFSVSQNIFPAGGPAHFSMTIPVKPGLSYFPYFLIVCPAAEKVKGRLCVRQRL